MPADRAGRFNREIHASLDRDEFAILVTARRLLSAAPAST
jgi:hypothetical protein